MGRPKKSAVKSFWRQAEHFETAMEKLDREEAAAMEKFKKQRDELKACTPKPVLDAIRAKARSEGQDTPGPPEPTPVAPSPPPKTAVTNGASKQPRAQA